ncbi:MAG: hypothetical protein SWH68_05530 [Thermodesulfobacteriota bacterium]|nr:hypothetical protein [Thermodesulfobacteriota bacterium]
MELRDQGDKTLQFIFNDLDPSDAVDFKKLLIELYDRKLISRSSLQLKMDLDPDIEAANRETESKKIDLMDEKQVKPVVDMVVSGILSMPRARKMLGIPAEDDEPTAKVALVWSGDLESTGDAAALAGLREAVPGAARAGRQRDHHPDGPHPLAHPGQRVQQPQQPFHPGRDRHRHP